MRLPTFLVDGAAKSGMTSLCCYLKQHPVGEVQRVVGRPLAWLS